jgi:RNase H-like domain found in reverse transcriptase
VNKDGNFYAISLATRQLKDHEKYYSPFLLEAAALWEMEIFNVCLRGKQFILYIHHKPLDKLGHLHNKTLNRLQSALVGTQLDHPVQKGLEHASQLPVKTSGY